MPDAAQAAVIDLLDQLFERAMKRQTPSSGLVKDVLGKWFGLSSSAVAGSVRGLYIWGGVGRGKTMMMDMFCSALPAERRQRMHFHRFMRRVHDALGRHSGQANPLLKVADEIAAGGDILCFDEFFVSDIGDAMILGEVMTAARILEAPAASVQQIRCGRARAELCVAAKRAERYAIHHLTALSRNPLQWESGRGANLGRVIQPVSRLWSLSSAAL